MILLLLILLNLRYAYAIPGRFGHSAVLINDSIYYYGGDINVSTSAWSTELSILPIYDAYSVTDPPWKPASGPQDQVGGPAVFSHVAFLCGSTMIVIGEQVINKTTEQEPMVYSYSYELGRWNSFSLPSGNHLNRQGAASSTTKEGITYIWGGKRSGVWTRPALPTDMYRFDSAFPENSDTISNKGDLVPPLRYAHTQTLLPDGRIVVLGGFDSETGDAISLSDVWIYDTNGSSWSHVEAKKLDVDLKPASHSQVLMPDGFSIVVYGGYDGYHVFNDVAVLDTRTWTWTIKNTNAAVQGRADHTATLVGTNMIVAFGFTGVSTSLTLMSDIEILDTVTWSWTPQYTPLLEGGTKLIGDQPVVEDTSGSTSPSIAIVAGAVTGGLVVFVFILVLVYIQYKRQPKVVSDSESTIMSEHVADPPAIPPLPAPLKHKPIPQPLFINTTNLPTTVTDTLPSPWTPIRPLKRDEPYLASPISAVSFDFYPGDTTDCWLTRTIPISKPDDTYYPVDSSFTTSSSSDSSSSSNHSFTTCREYN